MNLLHCSLTLDSALSDWRGWIRKLSDADLREFKGKAAQFSLRSSKSELGVLEHIEGMVREEMGLRFDRLLLEKASLATILEICLPTMEEAWRVLEHKAAGNGGPAERAEFLKMLCARIRVQAGLVKEGA